MAKLESEKALVTSWAIQEVLEGMIVALGPKASRAIPSTRSAGMFRGFYQRGGGATSHAKRGLTESVGIVIKPSDAISRFHHVIVCADEVHPYLRESKGGGMWLLRKTIFAVASYHKIIILDSNKSFLRL